MNILFIEIETNCSSSLDKNNIKLTMKRKNKVDFNCKEVTSKYHIYNTETWKKTTRNSL